MVRTASARGTIGTRSTSPVTLSVRRAAIFFCFRGKSGSLELLLCVPALRRRLALRPPLHALVNPLSSELEMGHLDIVGAEVDAAAGTDGIGGRAGHIDVRLGEPGIAAHRAGKAL